MRSDKYHGGVPTDYLLALNKKVRAESQPPPSPFVHWLDIALHFLKHLYYRVRPGVVDAVWWLDKSQNLMASRLRAQIEDSRKFRDPALAALIAVSKTVGATMMGEWDLGSGSGGGGTITSVNGQTGPTVTLTAANVEAMTVFNVLNSAFGADPTGGTSSTAAFALAVTALNAAGGGIIQLPPGTYAGDLSFTSNVPAIVWGYGATLNVPSSTVGVTEDTGVTGASANSISVEGLTITGNADMTSTGVLIQDTSRSRLFNVIIDRVNKAVDVENATSGMNSEGTTIQSSLLNNCTTGVNFGITGGGPSFDETWIADTSINRVSVGISMPTGSNWVRSYINATIWAGRAGTTFAGTNGTALSALATLPLTSTAGMATSGNGTIATSGGSHTFSYTGVTGGGSGGTLTGVVYSGTQTDTVATAAAVALIGVAVFCDADVTRSWAFLGGELNVTATVAVGLQPGPNATGFDAAEWWLHFQTTLNPAVDNTYMATGQMIFYRTGAGFRAISKGTSSGNLHGPFSQATTDTFPRVGLSIGSAANAPFPGGRFGVFWGSGAALADTVLFRQNAHVLEQGPADVLWTGHATTGSRPAANVAGAGGPQFYDDTLHQPIWTDNTSWRVAGTLLLATQALASNGAVTVDASLGSTMAVTLNANATSSSITNPFTGQRLVIRWIIGVGGGFTYVWPANCKFNGGSAPTPQTGAGNIDQVMFEYDGTNWRELCRAQFTS